MSSNDDLTSIFKLIESSEKILEDRKGFLSEVKSHIDEYSAQLPDVEGLNKDYRKKLNDLECEFLSIEREVQNLDEHYSLIDEQKMLLVKIAVNSNNKLNSIENSMEAFKKSFKKISDEFLSKYDLAGKWYSERKAWIKDKLISVVSEIAETTKEIKNFEKKSRDRVAVKDKLEGMMMLHLNKVEETERLARLKNTLSEFPDNDIYCKRLNDELKEMKENNMKDLCQNLSKELEFMQDRYILFCGPTSDSLRANKTT